MKKYAVKRGETGKRKPRAVEVCAVDVIVYRGPSQRQFCVGFVTPEMSHNNAFLRIFDVYKRTRL